MPGADATAVDAPFVACLALAVALAGTLSAAVAGCGDDSVTSADAGADSGGERDAVVDAPPLDAGNDAEMDAGALDGGAETLGLAIEWSASGSGFTFSSPRARDLDGDGVLDIVTGTGVEAAAGVTGVGAITALDGASGDVLWQTETRGELVGSASFVERAGESPLVVIGGRDETLVAVDAASGEIVWTFDEPPLAGEPGWFQFYTPAVVPDQTGDGVDDLVVASGGDAAAEPFAPRRPGHILVVDAASGALVSAMETPDAAETYMSPLVRRGATSALEVIFGTGGETLPGSIYRISLAALLAEDAPRAVALIGPESTKGMIAPPALVDLDGDGLLDVVAETFDGRLVAIAAADDAELWSVSTPDAESYMTPAIGRFDGDDVPDVLAIFSLGVFDDYTGSALLVVSGASGEVLNGFERGEGFAGSPLAVDLDADGVDDALAVLTVAPFESMALITFDASSAPAREHLVLPGGGLATPLVADLDGDGRWELILPRSVPTDVGPTWTVERRALLGTHPAPPSWGAYLGNAYDGRAR